MRLRVFPVLSVCALAACGDGGRASTSDPSTSGVSVTRSDPTETGTTNTPADTSAGATTTDPDGTSDDDPTDEGPLFDLGVLPDGGGPIDPMGGIPQTCAQAVNTQSTVGCSFHANKMQNFIEEPTSVIVGNVSESQDATVQLYWAPAGVEEAVGAPVVVPPGGTHEFVLNQPLQPGNVSVLRQGAAHRVETDVPVVAYQHSPIAAVAHNDSSLLIPDHALGQYYIVAAWSSNIGGHSSAFNVVGVHDGTSVTWTPPNATSAGTGVAAVAAGATGMATVDHYDLLQVIAPTDISGTIVETSQPAWVVGTVPCVNIPAGVTFCDHIEEQLIGLEFWGTEYVGAHAPNRGSEQYWWRVYSGSDGVTITTDPPQPGTPVMLDRGEYHEFSTQESFVITGDGPFMPVQYLESKHYTGQEPDDGQLTTYGDPAMYQMVPTEQFLNRYVFATALGFEENYVQIIRPEGGPDVYLDGDLVTETFVPVDEFEVATVDLRLGDFKTVGAGEGPHIIESEDDFGILQVGYSRQTYDERCLQENPKSTNSCPSSYAYPGGMKSDPIYIP